MPTITTQPEPTSDQPGVCDASGPPPIEHLRAVVAFDEFCRHVSGLYNTLRDECEWTDWTPLSDQLEAMLLDAVSSFMAPAYESEVREAVGWLVTALARPLEPGRP